MVPAGSLMIIFIYALDSKLITTAERYATIFSRLPGHEKLFPFPGEFRVHNVLNKVSAKK